MKIAVDSCSLILLAKATVLEKLADRYSLFISEVVYKEVMEGKIKKFIDSLLTERLVKENKIRVNGIKSAELTKKLEEDFSLGVGEAETLSLILNKDCDIILTDNKQGRKTAIIYDLDLIGSVEVVVSLYKLKVIDKNKAIDALKKLREFGWFQDYLIDNALEEVKNE